LGVGAPGVAIAGEDDAPPPPTDTQPVAPPPTDTQPVAPPPTETLPVVPPPPPAQKKPSTKSHRNSNKKAVTPQRVQRVSAPVQTVKPQLEFTGSTVDTGTVPQGGVQAGAGGTARGQGTSMASPALAVAVLALSLTAGGVMLRRRLSER
jgi:hypothetical protein